MNRLLLAMAFLPTGMVKLLGERFTTLGMDNPVGFFFEAMYRTGPYWHFIGLVQVVAAVLLLIPRTATLGAVLFVPVAVSILLITIGIGFGGTVLVVAGMVLAVTYLVCWDFDRIFAAAAILARPGDGGSLLQSMHRLEGAGWILGGAVGMAMLLAARGMVPRAAVPVLFRVGIGAFAMVVAGWICSARRPRDA